jgi:hypothetical protein
MLLIALQLAVRGWASQHGWFYSDDFEFLSQATGRRLDLDYLFTPHDLHLMPGGVLLAWLVAHAGPFNWALASAMLVVLQAVASGACLAMLLRTFGRRWACLALLSFYLFSTLTLTGFMWWSSAVNQLPAQAAFFGAVSCHIAHLRSGRFWPALQAALLVVAGLLFFEKAVLIIGPLVLLTVVWPGGPGQGVVRRARANLRRSWRAVVLYAALAAGYLAFYLARGGGEQGTSSGPIDFGGLVDATLRRSLATTLLGGPWRWSSDNPPLGLVDAPPWAVTLSCVVIAVVVVLALLSGRGDWRAFVVLLPYLAVSILLTASGRGAQLGGFAGLELRYLADAAPVLTLALGLFFLRTRDAEPGSDSAQTIERSAPRRRRTVAVCVTAAVLAGGAVVSNTAYLRFWTGDFEAKTYTQAVRDSSERSPLRIVDAPVPELVMAATSFPSNLPSRMFAPLGRRVVALSQGSDLQALGTTGAPYAALVSGGAESRPGPVRGCGYEVTPPDSTVTLDGDPPDFFWWAEISYLAGSDGTAQIVIGGTVHEWPVEKGAHRYFLQGEGSVDTVTMRQVDGSGAVCVDRVSIGDVSAVEPLA